MGCGASVTNAAWRGFGSEIGRWRDAGRIVEFWWRDDDATRPVPAIERLLALASESQVPVALAVIPARADRALFPMLGPGVDVLQHGADHLNRSPAGEKKAEFPASESNEAALERLVAGSGRLAELAGTRSLGVLTPPWNRLPASMLPRLVSCGFCGLSRYGARGAAQAAPGLTEINTHIDLIAWRSGRGFVGEEDALIRATRHLQARRMGSADPDEPTGWLTHHACHDEAAWRFLARLFELLHAQKGVRWVRARELFARSAAP